MTSQDSDSLLESVKQGFTDGTNYHAYRPSYTDEVTDKVIELLRIDTTTGSYNVLELGAGTGIFTQKIANRLPKTVSLIATEPMSDFVETLKKSCPSIQTRQCAADSLPFENESIDGIVAAQSFHWFSNKPSLDEIYRVIKKNGIMVLLWNYNDQTEDWLNQVWDYVDSLRQDPCKYKGHYWKPAIDNHPGFQLEKNIVIKGHTLQGDIDYILKHWSTHSGIAKLEEADKKDKLGTIRQIIEGHPQTAGKETIKLQFMTDIFSYRKE